MTTDELKKIIHYDGFSGEFYRIPGSPYCGRGKKLPGGLIQAGGKTKNGYRSVALGIGRSKGSKRYLAHRVAWFYITGSWPTHTIDHINGDPFDNRFCNLRQATQSQNNMNRRSETGANSKYKGVCWDKSRNKFVAYITINRKRKHIGRFDSELDAARAHDEAAQDLHGVFCRLNFNPRKIC